MSEHMHAQPAAAQHVLPSKLLTPVGPLPAHRCFADTQPRIFEDSSLRILCNFSELVTRELERNIALAETLQQHLPPGLHEDAAAAAAHQQIAAARSQKGQQLLRSLDCVTR